MTNTDPRTDDAIARAMARRIAALTEMPKYTPDRPVDTSRNMQRSTKRRPARRIIR